ncbi:hypothetical protein Ahy_A10g048261 isoform A [Arachis hypogaea]|uniref:Uncharacterized protein n=1 Tax=Arachis hypogaea TaxID=3818 RepID=A0A445B4N2_ARAHY|nr:hypothetical protein Ahy_A10g048261 isoform A [Arachis hypogaea]
MLQKRGQKWSMATLFSRLHGNLGKAQIPAVTSTVLAVPLASPPPRLLLVTSIVLLANLLCIVASVVFSALLLWPSFCSGHHALTLNIALATVFFVIPSTAPPPRICYIPRSCSSSPISSTSLPVSSSLLSFLVVSPYFCHRLSALAIFLLWPPCPNLQHCAGHRLLCHPLHRASTSHLLIPRIEKEIGSLQLEEKKLLAEIKRTAKTGNEVATNIKFLLDSCLWNWLSHMNSVYCLLEPGKQLFTAAV